LVMETNLSPSLRLEIILQDIMVCMITTTPYLLTPPIVVPLKSMFRQSFMNILTTYKGDSKEITHHPLLEMDIGIPHLKWKPEKMRRNIRVWFGKSLKKLSNIIVNNLYGTLLGFELR